MQSDYLIFLFRRKCWDYNAAFLISQAVFIPQSIHIKQVIFLVAPHGSKFKNPDIFKGAKLITVCADPSHRKKRVFIIIERTPPGCGIFHFLEGITGKSAGAGIPNLGIECSAFSFLHEVQRLSVKKYVMLKRILW